MASPYDTVPELTHGYTVEQLDHATRWQIIKHVGTSAEAQTMMRYYLGKSRETAWRVVEHPSRTLVVCEGGHA